MRWLTAYFVLTSIVISSSLPAAEPMIVAHRGASYDAPENTMAAFKLAWEQKADGVEGDFYLTSDGRVVCTHDGNTKRVAGEKLIVEESTLAELQALDVGSWKDPKFADERMPTLEDVLAATPEGKKVFIELKSHAKVVPPMLEIIKKSNVPLENLVVISFHRDVIKACHEQLPELKSHWLTDYKESKEGEGDWRPSAQSVIETLRETGAWGLGSQANGQHFNADFIAALRDAGFKEFHVWTVDKAKTARHYRELGTWSITTNRPGWLREKLSNPQDEAEEAEAEKE
jgi:glycerophosphoryl diester phosphodiesterase